MSLYFQKPRRLYRLTRDLAWFRDHQHSMDKPIFLTLLHFATAILYELGLDKASSSDPSLVLANDMKGGVHQPPKPPTLEERRAWLGFFMLSSRYDHLA